VADGSAERKRWVVVALMAAVVAATCTRTFLAVYLLLPLGVFGATAAARTAVRVVRGLYKAQRDEVSEGARSLPRAVAWACLCGAVVWGHEVQSARVRADGERFAMALDAEHPEGGYPERATNAPAGCSYLRGAPDRFTLVCTLTPPFEKTTYSSHNKRWE
jgi:hypothetical protein